MAAPAALPRRAVLQGGALTGAAAVLVGCGLFAGGDDERGRSRDPSGGRDTRDLAAALHAEEELLSAYEAALDEHPGLRPRLRVARADHEEHRRVLLTLLADLDPSGPWAAALGGAVGPGAGDQAFDGRPPGGGPSPTDSAALAGSASPAPGGVPVAADPEQALAALVDLERAAASARTEQAVRADGRWAPLLGVLAASEASHAAVLAA